MEEEKKSQEVTEEVKPEDEIISENEGFNDQEEKNIDSKISEEIIEGVDEKVLEKVDNEYNSDSLTVLEGLHVSMKEAEGGAGKSVEKWLTKLGLKK